MAGAVLVTPGPLFLVEDEDLDRFSPCRHVSQSGQAETAGRTSREEAGRKGAEAWLRPRKGRQLAAAKAEG